MKLLSIPFFNALRLLICFLVFLIDLLYVLFLLYNSIKLSIMLPLREPPGGFCDNGCDCYFFLTGVFSFPYYFSMPLALHSGFPGPWRPPPALSSSLATFNDSFSQAFPSLVCLILLKVLWFWVSVFYPQLFFTFHSFPTFSRLCDSDASRNTPSRIFLYVCFHRVIPSSYRKPLNYWYSSCKTVVYLITLVSHKV